MRKSGRYSKKSILLMISIFAIVISLFFVFRYNKKVRYESSFIDLVKQQEYSKAIELYREIQRNATNIELSQNERNRYTDIKNQYESHINSLTTEIINRLKKGDRLTQNDANFITGMQEMTSSTIAPFLNDETEAYLDNKIDQMEWRHFIMSFENFPNLKTNVENLLSQEENLKIASEKFAEIDKKDLKSQWNTIWREWQEMTANQEIGRFARDYAEYRLTVFQKEAYDLLMTEIDAYMFANKYYSAKLLLDRLFDAFPNEEEIQEKLQICNEKIPSKLVVWEDLVENIAIRPLVADTVKAKSGAYKVFAETGMLTPKEFENLLYELYENNYVLVSQSLFHDYPEDYSQVVVPEGKKPVVMIFEEFQYSTRYTESGSVEQMVYHEESNQFSSRKKANLKDSEADDLDPVNILEKFLVEHSDFSFDGAKAMIAINVDENILGYMINEKQLQNDNAARKQFELEPHILTDRTQEEKNKFFTLQLEDLKVLLNGLSKNGYQFANATYSGQNLRELSETDFELEITEWEDIMKPLIGTVDAFLFPVGAHVYENSEKLEFLMNSGYCNFYSESPSVYNFFAEKYLHFDYFPVNGNSLMNSEAWGLARFGDANKIIEDWRN